MQACFKLNTHGRSLEDIQHALSQWEETPAVYPQLDVDSLFNPNKHKRSREQVG